MKNFFRISITTFFIFIILDALIGKNFYKKFLRKSFVDRDVSFGLEDEYYHHKYKKSFSTKNAKWGNNVYDFCTDENGFRTFCGNNKTGKKFDIGKNFYLIYSPERDDPGNNIKNFYVPRLISGKTKKCLVIGKAIYSKIFQTLISTTDMQTAEITKLFENVFRSINIGLVNEMKKICHKMNMNIHEIIEAASSKPYGFFKFLPGPGLGGHCIPIDPFYLSWKAKKYNLDAEFISLAGKINRSMPAWVISRVSNFFKKKRKTLKRKKILILGVAYKKNINDTRESPAFEIIKILKKKYKALVEYHDPFVPIIKNLRNHDISMRSIKITPKKIREFDIIILVTDHDNLNYKLLEKHSNLLVDTRDVVDKNLSNVISL